MRDFAAQIGGDALQPADRDGSRFETASSARGLAGTVARSAEDRRENVRFPVDHVGLGVLALSDEADVLRDVGMRGTGPLAIDNAVEILRVANVAGFQRSAPEV